MDQTFWNSFDQDQVQVFGINNGETLSNTTEFARSFGLSFPVLSDRSSEVYRQYAVTGLTPYPRDCIIDQNGIVRYLHSEYDPQVMLQIVNDLLVTDIENDPVDQIPQSLNLRVFPNPFNPTTTIEFTIEQSGPLQLALYNGLGQKLKTLKNEVVGSGKHQVNFDGSGLSSGVYFIRLLTGNQQKTHKILLIK